VFLYMRQEGRGIGLLSKLHSYNLQDEGFDTIEANTALGYQPDAREYDIAFMILSDLGIRSIRLLSNNPDKLSSIGKGGIEVISMIAINPRVTKDNIRYLETKVERFHHLINVGANSYHSPEIEKLLRFVDRANATNGSGLPHITLFFNQTLNGLITDPRLICELDTSNELLALRNRLRDKHQAMLVDAHSLNLSLEGGRSTDYLTIVFDRDLQGLERLGPSSIPNKLLVLAKEAPEQQRMALEGAGAEVVVLPKRAHYRYIMSLLEYRGIDSIIVEGSPPMLQRAMFDEHVDLIVGVISPHMPDSHPTNGWRARTSGHCLSFKEIHYLNIGSALVYYGIPSALVEAR
jgi:3,4-dihydroxy 2-butanone 4-phosphate synthase/GTP cyclohydrolase II